jgi:glucan biosynthesis protein
MLSGQGEYLWRPLNNPQTLQVSAFVDSNPRGFGLVQRHRALEDFEDLQANYHKRPSTWVAPRGAWGPGQVVLVEIPTRSEANDNIVAYWRPETPLLPGEVFNFAYQLTWPDDSPLPRDTARIRRTAYGLKLASEFPQIVLDYTGLPAGIDVAKITFEASVGSGTLLETLAEPSGAGSARVYLTFDPERAAMSEIRVQPRYQGASIGETLLYRWLER